VAGGVLDIPSPETTFAEFPEFQVFQATAYVEKERGGHSNTFGRKGDIEGTLQVKRSKSSPADDLACTDNTFSGKSLGFRNLKEFWPRRDSACFQQPDAGVRQFRDFVGAGHAGTIRRTRRKGNAEQRGFWSRKIPYFWFECGGFTHFCFKILRIIPSKSGSKAFAPIDSRIGVLNPLPGYRVFDVSPAPDGTEFCRK